MLVEISTLIRHILWPKGVATKRDVGMVRVLDIPKILHIQEAKNQLSKIMDSLEHGQTYVIKGTKGRSAFVIGLDEFIELQEAYVQAIKKLETRRALDKEEIREALKAASEEELPQTEDELVTSAEVKEYLLSKHHN
jgi:hypothetical protein